MICLRSKSCYIWMCLCILSMFRQMTSRDELPNMITMLEEPLADPAALSVTFISRLLRQMGTKVLLSGVGGDDLCRDTVGTWRSM